MKWKVTIWISFICFNFIVIAIDQKELCKTCVRTEKCAFYGQMTKSDQEKWISQNSCENEEEDVGILFGFAPVAKGDYICCPAANVWGIEGESSTKTEQRTGEQEVLDENDKEEFQENTENDYEQNKAQNNRHPGFNREGNRRNNKGRPVTHESVVQGSNNFDNPDNRYANTNRNIPIPNGPNVRSPNNFNRPQGNLGLSNANNFPSGNARGNQNTYSPPTSFYRPPASNVLNSNNPNLGGNNPNLRGNNSNLGGLQNVNNFPVNRQPNFPNSNGAQNNVPVNGAPSQFLNDNGNHQGRLPNGNANNQVQFQNGNTNNQNQSPNGNINNKGTFLNNNQNQNGNINNPNQLPNGNTNINNQGRFLSNNPNQSQNGNRNNQGPLLNGNANNQGQFQSGNRNNQFNGSPQGSCAATINFPPESQSGCCGRDANSERNNGIQNNFMNRRPAGNQNRRMPGNSFSYPGQNRFSRAADNETVDFSVDNRITGGKETELHQFPWLVLLKTTFDYGTREAAFNCGGSIISSRYVLTAAHCVQEDDARVSGVDVYLAEYDKRSFPNDCVNVLGEGRKCIENIVVRADIVIPHAQYDDRKLQNDIALVRLRETAPYTEYIRPICLPPIDIDNPDYSNLRVAIAGWGRNGRLTSQVKQSAVVHLVPQRECSDSYPQLTRRHLCAQGHSGEDTCKGDSGGPLMMLYEGQYYISGVVSGKRADAPCGTAVPSLYTNVYHYLDWIRSNIRN